MKTLKQWLDDRQGTPVAAVAPTDTVLQALRVMAERDVGALLVLKDGKLVGIFSERDYARKVALHGKTSGDTPVSEVMSERVAYVTPKATIDECMSIMNKKHFRHLPVLTDEGTVVGVISIGDAVKETISAQKFAIEQLEQYISG